MPKALISRRHQVQGYAEALEYCHRSGWTDGLPVVPPTEDRVAAFLDHAGLDPDQVLGEVTERAKVVTAEKLAVNAVMAGCLPEYMPVLVAAVEALTEPRYKFNHLASLGSPWPLIIVNGPIVKQIGLNSGIYLFGPGSRPNATIARAISLVLRNCAEARVEAIQRGQWGNPNRWAGCIGENEDTEWTPLHVQRGFDRNSSAVTVVSTYPGVPIPIRVVVKRPERLLDVVCHSFGHFGGALWARGTYTLLVGPHQAEIFIREGWTKEDVRRYIFENTRTTIADLKFRGIWGAGLEGLTEEVQEIQPGDDGRYISLFRDNGEYERYMWSQAAVADARDVDVFVVVAGGNAGDRLAFGVPYQFSTNPVTKPVSASFRNSVA